MQVEILDVKASSEGKIQFLVYPKDQSFLKIPGTMRIVLISKNFPTKARFKLAEAIKVLEKPHSISGQMREGGLRKITLNAPLNPDQLQSALANSSILAKNFVLERIGAGGTTNTSNEIQVGEGKPVTDEKPASSTNRSGKSEYGETTFLQKLKAAFRRPEVIGATVLALSFIGFLIAQNDKSKSTQSTTQN